MPLSKELLDEFVELAPVVGLSVGAFTEEVGATIRLDNDEVEMYADNSECDNAPACYLIRKAIAEAGFDVILGKTLLVIPLDEFDRFQYESGNCSETEMHVLALIATAKHKQENPS